MSSSSNEEIFKLWDRNFLNREMIMPTPDWIKAAYDSLEKNPDLIPEYARRLCCGIMLPGDNRKLSRLGVSIVVTLAKKPGFPKELVSLGYLINQSVPTIEQKLGPLQTYLKALKARRTILKYVKDNF